MQITVPTRVLEDIADCRLNELVLDYAGFLFDRGRFKEDLYKKVVGSSYKNSVKLLAAEYRNHPSLAKRFTEDLFTEEENAEEHDPTPRGLLQQIIEAFEEDKKFRSLRDVQRKLEKAYGKVVLDLDE